MRAIWKGAVSFGLVNVPVRLFSATQEHDIRFHQVHRVLTDEDFEQLPLSTGREIDVIEFVPTGQVDPVLFGKSYYLEPDARAAKPYALLREALETTDRVAIVKVALRQRESLAVLRVRDQVIMMQTLLWPDEIRAADFPILEEDVELRPQELRMAASLVDSMAADFEPDQYEDDYQQALVQLVEAKLEGAAPAPVEAEEETTTEVVDLLSALQASVDRAKESRGEKPSSSGGVAKKTAGKSPAKKTAAAKSSSPAKKAPAKKTAAKSTAKTTTKKTATRKSA